MVLINFKILNGIEENRDIISYSTMIFLIMPSFQVIHIFQTST